MTSQTSSMTLRALLQPYVLECEENLHRWLVEPGTPDELAEAMRYCTMDGGKRLRPALVAMVAELFGSTDRELMGRCGVAIEMVHCYSLVHDDLPAMDDDTLRRGRPTAHVQFGEAMAILVGDALLTRAFGVLAESQSPHSAALVTELAGAAGPAGMIAGQAADMALCSLPEGFAGLEYIHLRKTAAMLRASAGLGAICADASESDANRVRTFAEKLGLAFQMYDDLLDVTGQAEVLGKTPGKDANSGKRTVVAELGIDKARQLADQLTAQAIEAVQPFKAKAHKLICLAQGLTNRKH